MPQVGDLYMVVSRSPSPRAGRALIPLFCAVGGALTGAYYMLSNSATGQHVVYQLIGLWGVGGLAYGVRRHRPAGPAWPLVLMGLMLWVSGDGYWNVYRLVTGVEAPFPSPADALYLLAYVPLLAGIVIMVRGGKPRLADIVDALIIGLAMGLVVWFAAIHPTTQTHRPSLVSALIADAYPTMDYLLVLALAQLLVSRVRNTALMWVTSAFVTVLVTDVVYAWLRSSSSFTASSLVNAGYFGFYVMLGAAALSPSMGSLSEPITVAEGRTSADSGHLTLVRLGLLSMALLASPGALVLQGSGGDLASLLVIAAVGAVVSLLVLVRLSILFVERDRIDDRRVRAEAALQRMAYHDWLTDLPNRSALISAVDREIADATSGQVFGVLFVDLDGFKEVNDRFGHTDGDQVLRDTASRLGQAVRGDDIVARHGGDEFVVLLRGLPEDPADTVRSAIERVRAAVSVPVAFGSAQSGDVVTITLGASVGVALYPADGRNAQELIRVADGRMYSDKTASRGRADAA